jgi:hypothetical protein
VLLQASLEFPRGRGIGSAALRVSNLLMPTSIKSVWPLRAAEQTLRLRPASLEADRPMLARLRVASGEGRQIDCPVQPSRFSLPMIGTVFPKLLLAQGIKPLLHPLVVAASTPQAGTPALHKFFQGSGACAPQVFSGIMFPALMKGRSSTA